MKKMGITEDQKEKKQIVIGLTGTIGSGCTTIAKHLEKQHKFVYFCNF